MPDTAYPRERVVRALQDISSVMRNAGAGSTLHLDAEDTFCNVIEQIQDSSTFQRSLGIVSAALPEVARPLWVHVPAETDAPAEMRLGSLPLEASDPQSMEIALEDLDFIETIAAARPREETEAYVFGRDRQLNPDTQIATIRAATPVEAALKLQATLAPGFGADPEGGLKFDVNAAGPMQMRRQHDWEKQDVDTLFAVVRDEISMSIETETPDFS